MIDAKRKAFIFLTLAFILAVIAAGLFVTEIRKMQEAMGETIRVAIANEDIPTYTEITEEMIRWVEIPRNEYFETSLLRHQADFRDSIAIVYIREGDILTHNMLRAKVELPANHRIVWLNASDNVLIDQQVGEGDLVDIFVTFEEEGVKRTKRWFTNIEVVSAIQDTQSSTVKVSIPIPEAEELIHFQNTAQQIRVLLVHQIQRREGVEEETPAPTEELDEAPPNVTEQEDEGDADNLE